jgi:hypothetical protein
MDKTLFVDNVKGHPCVKAYFFHYGIEQDLLNEVQVLGHHDYHIDRLVLYKGLYGSFYTFVGNGMETVSVREGLLHIIKQVFLVRFLFQSKRFPFFDYIHDPELAC